MEFETLATGYGLVEGHGPMSRIGSITAMCAAAVSSGAAPTGRSRP